MVFLLKFRASSSRGDRDYLEWSRRFHFAPSFLILEQCFLGSSSAQTSLNYWENNPVGQTRRLRLWLTCTHSSEEAFGPRANPALGRR